MNTEAILLRLSEGQSISHEEALVLLDRVNFLEKFVANLLTSIKRKKRVIDVCVPFRAQAL